MSCAEEERVKDTAGPLRYSSEGEKDRRQNKARHKQAPQSKVIIKISDFHLEFYRPRNK